MAATRSPVVPSMNRSSSMRTAVASAASRTPSSAEGVEGIGAQLDARADLPEDVAALQDGHLVAAAGKGDRRGKAADAASGDEDLGHVVSRCPLSVRSVR
ncbi:hypothetical protein GCM10020000_41640 [Streptomyces olivoverticillatus]